MIVANVQDRRTTNQAGTDYALGYTNAEQERLIRQAEKLAPITERFFREAGIGSGQRVLDLGSGMGDVTMLVARLVGPSGEVVGVERDTNSIARARARAAAAVGRFILMFLPDPVPVLRSAVGLVRPGGVIAFQEPSWAAMLALGSGLPLWSR